MVRPRAFSSAACVLFALLVAPSAAVARASAPAAVPQLLFQAPADLRGVAERLEALEPSALEPAMQRSGLVDPGPPILVVLAPESSPAARARPPWFSGYANGAAGVVVLMPARTGRYPDGSLVALLQHEVAHVLIARAARGGEVPRWFDEGLAMAASRDTQFGDRTRVALAVLTDSRLPLARIDATFAGGSSEVESAYALARDVVRELLERHGQDAGARILAGVARGLRFKEAFLEATGETLGTFETRYWDDRTFWDRWIPILTSSALLWGGISLLAIAAIRRRRTRDRERMARWEAEERPLEEEPPPASGDGPPPLVN
ncbi:MAG: hypothetical protein KDB94_09935 [Acidobacteria bacterium]|nr:hypothetical protein [Acidobacteriota bacterium]MCB9378140.1 hypothetical protein [Holophagales bacterium]